MPSTIRTDTALLVLRLMIGLAFLLHGLDKVGDIGAVKDSFTGLGIPLPELMAPLVTFTELLGGIALMVGLLTPLVGLALAVNMLVAWLTVHTGKGFFVAEGGPELVLVLGVAALAIAIAGAGRFSLDAVLGIAERMPGVRRASVTS